MMLSLEIDLCTIHRCIFYLTDNEAALRTTLYQERLLIPLASFSFNISYAMLQTWDAEVGLLHNWLWNTMTRRFQAIQSVLKSLLYELNERLFVGPELPLVSAVVTRPDLLLGWLLWTLATVHGKGLSSLLTNKDLWSIVVQWPMLQIVLRHK